MIGIMLGGDLVAKVGKEEKTWLSIAKDKTDTSQTRGYKKQNTQKQHNEFDTRTKRDSAQWSVTRMW
jgi:hypothetical protein